MHRWFLAQNPAALAKLEEELHAAGLLKTAKNPNPRPFTYADIGKLHWLDCCIKVCTPPFLPCFMHVWPWLHKGAMPLQKWQLRVIKEHLLHML